MWRGRSSGSALAALALGASAGSSRDQLTLPPNAAARVTRTVRLIERHPDARLTLSRLAQDAGLSPYHFLRTFERLTGVTPHQFIMRARLREAAMRLASERGSVLDIALDCGFGDVSNFNRAFRTEFGVSPSRVPSVRSCRPVERPKEPRRTPRSLS